MAMRAGWLNELTDTARRLNALLREGASEGYTVQLWIEEEMNFGVNPPTPRVMGQVTRVHKVADIERSSVRPPDFREAEDEGA